MNREEMKELAKSLGIQVGNKSNVNLLKELQETVDKLNLELLRAEQGINPAAKPEVVVTKKIRGQRITENRTHRYGVL